MSNAEAKEPQIGLMLETLKVLYQNPNPNTEHIRDLEKQVVNYFKVNGDPRSNIKTK